MYRPLLDHAGAHGLVSRQCSCTKRYSRHDGHTHRLSCFSSVARSSPLFPNQSHRNINAELQEYDLLNPSPRINPSHSRLPTLDPPLFTLHHSYHADRNRAFKPLAIRFTDFLSDN